MLTFGMEEEYLLLDAVTGLPRARAVQVRDAAGLQPALDSGEVQHELLQAQLEVATPVCHDLDEGGGHLLRMRHALGQAARADGCVLAACAAAPFAGTDGMPVPVTPTARYRAMRGDTGRLTDEQLIAGMHVHIGVPDRAAGVTVLNRLRPWLPLLIAFAANSPLWHSTDTGFASWRTPVFGRWPVSGPPPHFDGDRDYDRRTTALVRDGLIPDIGQLYWHVRLSERYPTVETRAMDVQLRPDEAVMLAGVVRALATRALADERAGRPGPAVLPEQLAAAVWHGARHGCTGTVFDPLAGRLVAPAAAAATLLEHVDAALEADGEHRHIVPVLERLLREGNGAVRQRRVLREHGRRQLLAMIADQTTGA
ncbi:glutamate--cysteine ligase [Streptomyces sp. BE20]|uniref:carboxylate-amine ligase n=1 Tax=unclassified Streptomyces TaxID=2593676 RepID=UPI002E7A7303|nr:MULTISPECIES: glutamate--cysteine ligase [unclassified Streptomyces]MED7950449.1 glutamate--cysteine ligase [Streptomyces sp. BE303]MEE1824334.1 glutamate--cysteine ligase [Streptomyces sp. BE20]